MLYVSRSSRDYTSLHMIIYMQEGCQCFLDVEQSIDQKRSPNEGEHYNKINKVWQDEQIPKLTNQGLSIEGKEGILWNMEVEDLISWKNQKVRLGQFMKQGVRRGEESD